MNITHLGDGKLIEEGHVAIRDESTCGIIRGGTGDPIRLGLADLDAFAALQSGGPERHLSRRAAIRVLEVLLSGVYWALSLLAKPKEMKDAQV